MAALGVAALAAAVAVAAPRDVALPAACGRMADFGTGAFIEGPGGERDARPHFWVGQTLGGDEIRVALGTTAKTRGPCPLEEDPWTPDPRELDAEWVFCVGDSSMRQIHSGFVQASEMLNRTMGFDQIKRLYRSRRCHRQTELRTPSEFICKSNEKRCDFASDDGALQVTFDWKHLAGIDAYDEHMLAQLGETPAPDVFVASLGIHDCFHFGLHANLSDHIDEFVRRLHGALDRERTVLLWLDSPHSMEHIDSCTHEVNAMLRAAIDRHSERRPLRTAIIERWDTTRRSDMRNLLNDDAVHWRQPVVRMWVSQIMHAVRCLRDTDLCEKTNCVKALEGTHRPFEPGRAHRRGRAQ